MEKTLLIIKPSAIQRELVGEVISRFEKKGLVLAGIKMIQLDNKILDEHYTHLKGKPFFQQVKSSMKVTPVVVCCWKGLDAVNVVRSVVGVTNGRIAQPGTIRGDYSMSVQENIVHASDTTETAEIELKRFFRAEELFDYKPSSFPSLYADDEF